MGHKYEGSFSQKVNEAVKFFNRLNSGALFEIDNVIERLPLKDREDDRVRGRIYPCIARLIKRGALVRHGEKGMYRVSDSKSIEPPKTRAGREVHKITSKHGKVKHIKPVDQSLFEREIDTEVLGQAVLKILNDQKGTINELEIGLSNMRDRLSKSKLEFMQMKGEKEKLIDELKGELETLRDTIKKKSDTFKLGDVITRKSMENINSVG